MRLLDAYLQYRLHFEAHTSFADRCSRQPPINRGALGNAGDLYSVTDSRILEVVTFSIAYNNDLGAA